MVTTFFVDTSALAKRYLDEAGSIWTIGWITPASGNIIVIAELAYVEMRSLVARRVREGNLTTASARTIIENFNYHFEKEYIVVPLEAALVRQAADLTARYPLRALDAMQLASAAQAFTILQEPMTFVSADRNLLAAATSENFTATDPNLHAQSL